MNATNVRQTNTYSCAPWTLHNAQRTMHRFAAFTCCIILIVPLEQKEITFRVPISIRLTAVGFCLDNSVPSVFWRRLITRYLFVTWAFAYCSFLNVLPHNCTHWLNSLLPTLEVFWILVYLSVAPLNVCNGSDLLLILTLKTYRTYITDSVM